MDNEYIRFRDVSFTYDTMTSPLIKGLSFDLARGWTGIIGANGAGKTTIMCPDDRIALTGQNGGGKSSLIRHILKILDIPRNQLTYVPQEIDQGSSKEIISRALELSGERLGKMMAVVSRLGSRPHRLLQSRQPSPGETRKLLLATGIASEPHLIIMDEPTNHMDLPSIEYLEKALEGCPCGLLLVSHDRRFLEKLTDRHWHISSREESPDDFRLQVI